MAKETYGQEIGFAAASLKTAIFSSLLFHFSMVLTNVFYPKAFEKSEGPLDWYTDEVALLVMAPAMIYSAAILINALTAKEDKVNNLIYAAATAGILCVAPLTFFLEDVHYDDLGQGGVLAPILSALGVCFALVGECYANRLTKPGVVTFGEGENKTFTSLFDYWKDTYYLVTRHPGYVNEYAGTMSQGYIKVDYLARSSNP